MNKIKLDEGERIEDLQCKGLKIIQNKSLYTFTSDSVILANFIKLHSKDNALEIGTGSGIISILQTAKNKFNKIVAFELQPQLAALAKKNVALNGLEDKIEVINDDILNYKSYKFKPFDCIFCNPPYMSGDGSNQNAIRDKARHEGSLKLAWLCDVTSKLLKEGGKFYVVYDANRSCELITMLVKHNLQPKRMFFTQNGKGVIKRIVIEAVKGGKSGVKVLPELVTNEASGEYLENLHTKYI